ncbi:sugar MFS transporter [Bacteriovorax sp. Seq25_V]|uniref:MFS transporter n=1 Tax=Bacteriovorax sp. Seq25_V TaxID=1201288 RepID=UPI00038A01C5|nr:MFS transporter [Bacteriovorax sp. Seq25_V]EQC45440.1 transporter, major facilitator family protein [Bacteriovorax sp. Seq25_V]
MKNKGFIILGYLALVALSFIDNGRGATYPQILETFHASGSQGSLIFSLASFTGLVTNFSTALWLPHLGLVWGTRLFVLTLSIAALGVSLSPNFWITLFFAAIAGVGFGGIGITMNIMVSEGAPAHLRRRFLSGLHGTYGVASFLAPLVFNLIMKLEGNWRTYFLLAVIPPLLVFLYSFTVHDTHKESIKDTYKTMRVSKKLKFLIGIYMGLYVASEILVSTRLTLYLTEVKGLSITVANTYLSGFFLCLLIGRLSFAALNIRISSSRLLYTSLILTLIAFLFGYYIHPVFLSVTGITMSYFFPVSVEWINENFKEVSNLLISSSMTIIGITLMIMHQVFGTMTELISVEYAFLFFIFYNLGSISIFHYLRSSKFLK